MWGTAPPCSAPGGGTAAEAVRLRMRQVAFSWGDTVLEHDLGHFARLPCAVVAGDLDGTWS